MFSFRLIEPFVYNTMLSQLCVAKQQRRWCTFPSQPQLSDPEHKVPRKNKSTDAVSPEETVESNNAFFSCPVLTVRLSPGPENDALEACQGITAAKNVLSVLIYH